MKKQFSITIEDNEGEEVLEAHMKGFAWKCVVGEFDSKLREMIKYKDIKTVDPQEVRDLLHEIIREENLSLW